MARYLKINHGTEGPQNLLFFDTESTVRPIPGKPHQRSLSLRSWCAIALRIEKGKVTRRAVRHGTHAAEFWAFVAERQDKKKPLWCWAHNLGFDLTQLHFWAELEAKRFTAGPVERPPCKKTGKKRNPWNGTLCLEARPTFAVVKSEYGLARFVDTGNFWPSSLATIGETFGLPKLKMPADDATDDEWRVYCERDAEVCERAVLSLLEQWKREDCGVFKMTAPALAMQHFRHTCKLKSKSGHAIKILCEPNEPHHTIERESYYGGRVQPFFLGTYTGRVYHLDCVSLYLSCMSANAFPICRRKLPQCHTPDDLLRRVQAFGAVAHVRINSRDDTYPIRINNVQQHCCGVFWTTLAGPELRRALGAGHVTAIGEHHLYVMDRPFTDWADYWFTRKRDAARKGDEGKAELDFAKLLGNSLSGKWAQKGRFWKDRPEIVCKVPWGQWITYHYEEARTQRFRGIGRHTQELVDGSEPDHSFPLISAYIAAYGRERMRLLFELLPPRSLLYTATDSLIVTQAGYDALAKAYQIDHNMMGQLAVKGVHQECEIIGSNWYRLDQEWTIAGWYGKRKSSAEGREVVDVWQRLPSIIGQRPDGTVRISELEVLPSHSTPKGRLENGNWVVPFRLSPDEDFSDKAPKPKLWL